MPTCPSPSRSPMGGATVPAIPENLAAILLTSKDKRTPAQASELFRFFVSKNTTVADRIRLHAAQDIAWALVNTPAFLFNR